MNDSPGESIPADKETLGDLRRTSRRGFAIWLGGLAAGVFGVRWIATRPEEANIPWPLRRILELNEKVSQSLIGTGGLAPEFKPTDAGEPRVNGRYGLADDAMDMNTWRLQVRNEAGKLVELTFADIQALPFHEHITELKCIEGWSQVVHWGGCRLSDLLERTGLARPSPDAELYPYVGLATQDAAYYVGLDTPSAMHPQTLLAYKMNGQPLTPGHGAPLRLVIPVKYGIKNIKAVASIKLTTQRPADYWAERGYDWFAGL
jgi:DMSO/TMAO reductase YedYZ molybdopterin-dependent catalytic subunit